jgi:hypothetical protein
VSSSSKEDEEDERIFRSYVLCEEVRRQRYPTKPFIPGGYRWLRSENVIDLDRYRKTQTLPSLP